MPSKHKRYFKPRYLALEVVYNIPQGVSTVNIARTLIASVKSGTYLLPRGWRVAILWKNKAGAAMKIGRWQKVLNDSASASAGFDSAVISYLEEKL